MDDRSYEGILHELIGASGVTTISPDELAPYVVDWLEDDSDPFGEGWDMFRQMAPVVEQGDVADDAVSITQLKASLAARLTGRRLAWVLADLDADVSAIADYLRHWRDDGDMVPLGNAVMSRLRQAGRLWLVALEDSDVRTRGFAASLLSQLREAQSPDTNEEALLQAALHREVDSVAHAAMLLALSPAGDRPSATTEAVRRLTRPGGIDPLWGVKHQGLPAIVQDALARITLASRQLDSQR